MKILSSIIHFHLFEKLSEPYSQIEKCDCGEYRIFSMSSSLDEGDWHRFYDETELQRVKNIIDGKN